MTRLLVVVPPAALSMAGGPPSALPLLAHAARAEGLEVAFFDGNVAFHRFLLHAEAREAVSGELRRRIQGLLSLPSLDEAALGKLGRLLSFAVAEQERSDRVPRTGLSWSGVEEVLQGVEEPGGPDRPGQVGQELWSRALDALARDILAFQPDVIAWSVLLHEQLRGFVGLARRVADSGQVPLSLLGGAVAKLMQEPILLDLLDETGVDLAWREDLFAFPASLVAWFRGEVAAEAVEGGGLIVGGAEPRISRQFGELARELPGPLTWDAVESADHLHPRIVPVLVSVGCYWGRCDFCDYPYLATRAPGSSATRFRSPEAVAADLLILRRRHGVEQVDLVSDAVAYSWFSRLEEVAGDDLRASGPALECSLRAESFARASHFRTMARVGMQSLTLGVEVLHDEVLEGMEKGNTVADVMRCASLARDAGIRVKANIIVDHPRIQARHLPSMLEALDRLAPYLDALGVHRFSLSPHAPILEDLAALGLERVAGRARTDHGTHAIPFRSVRAESDREEAVMTLADRATALMYTLEHRSGRVAGRPKVIRLPHRWRGTSAERTGDVGDLFVQVPAIQAPFRFFVGAVDQAEADEEPRAAGAVLA